MSDPSSFDWVGAVISVADSFFHLGANREKWMPKGEQGASSVWSAIVGRAIGTPLVTVEWAAFQSFEQLSD